MRSLGLSGRALLAAVAAPLAAFSCVHWDGGLDYAKVGITAEDSSGNTFDVACVTLPVLLGSQNSVRENVRSDFDVAVSATRREATVRFERGGNDLVSPITVDADDLQSGYSRTVTIDVPGETYTVELSSTCPGDGSGAGGFPSGRGGSGGRIGTGGAGGSGGGGAGGASPLLRVTALVPEEGPYGTEVTLTGTGLGSETRPAVTLTLGDGPWLPLDPTSTPHVVAWSETEIRFRFPFPLEGAIVLRNDRGFSASAPDFTPSWDPGPSFPVSPATRALAAISTGPGRLVAVIDTDPPTVVEHDGTAWATGYLNVTNVLVDTIRIYLDQGNLRGFALSTSTPSEIVAIEPSPTTNGDFDGVPTGIALGPSNTENPEFAIAGGTNGAVVWFQQGNDWQRARPGTTGWALEGTPIPDPNPSGTLRAAAATSDGSLYVAWAEATGSLLDDQGAPFMARLPAGTAAFEAKVKAGIDVDDYLTNLTLEGRSDGVLLHYCGSNVDPLGVSPTELYCTVALHPTAGTSTLRNPKETESLRYAIRRSVVGAAQCDANLGLLVVPDLSTLGSPTATSPEIAAWPCPPVLAAEFDGQGDLLTIVRHGSDLYAPRPRPPPAPAPTP